GVACAGDPFTRVPATAATIITDNAVVRRTIISPPSVRHYDQSPDDYAPVSPGAQSRVSVPATIIGTAVPRPQGHQRLRRVESEVAPRSTPPPSLPRLRPQAGPTAPNPSTAGR